MTFILFADLDDTLMQTREKCPADADVLPVAYDKEGLPLSYITQEQRTFFEMANGGLVIPVTGRNHDAVKRVDLPFTSYKVISHGAVILDEKDIPLLSWMERISGEIEVWRDFLERMNAMIQDRILRDGLKLRSRVIYDYDVPAYISVKADDKSFNAHFDSLADIFDGFLKKEGGRVHVNGRNAALMPAYTKKERAVEHLMAILKEKHGLPLFIGAGDSVTDIPFMNLCHYQIKPQHSQIQYG